MEEEERTKIKGVTFDDPHTGMNRQEIIRRYVRSGTRLVPRLEPDNPVDPGAVAIWLENEDGQFHLGYLSKERAETVGGMLRAGCDLEATVSGVTGGVAGKPTLGVNIVIREVAVSEPESKGHGVSREVVIGVGLGLVLFIVCCLVPACFVAGDVVLREVGILPTWTPGP